MYHIYSQYIWESYISDADTPGIHLHHRLPHLLTPEELKQLHPRRRLKPYYPPAPEDLAQEEEDGALSSSGSANE